MKSLPTDPFALHARMMDALIGDILDAGQKGFGRLDAMRATLEVDEVPMPDDGLVYAERVAPLPEGWSRIEL